MSRAGSAADAGMFSAGGEKRFDWSQANKNYSARVFFLPTTKDGLVLVKTYDGSGGPVSHVTLLGGKLNRQPEIDPEFRRSVGEFEPAKESPLKQAQHLLYLETGGFLPGELLDELREDQVCIHKWGVDHVFLIKVPITQGAKHVLDCTKRAYSLEKAEYRRLERQLADARGDEQLFMRVVQAKSKFLVGKVYAPSDSVSTFRGKRSLMGVKYYQAFAAGFLAVKMQTLFALSDPDSARSADSAQARCLPSACLEPFQRSLLKSGILRTFLCPAEEAPTAPAPSAPSVAS